MKFKEFLLKIFRYTIFFLGIYHLLGGFLGVIYNIIAVMAVIFNKNIFLKKPSLLNSFFYIIIGFAYIKCAQGLNLKEMWALFLSIVILFADLFFALQGLYKNIFYMGRPIGLILLNTSIALFALLYLMLFFKKGTRIIFK